MCENVGIIGLATKDRRVIMLNCRVEKEPFIIIGGDAEGKNISDILFNRLSHLSLEFKPVRGFYTIRTTGQSIEEDSFMVIVPNKEILQKCIDLALTYKQESVLYVDSERNAKLVFLDPTMREESLGKFSPFTKEEIISKGFSDYTFDGSYYYACV